MAMILELPGGSAAEDSVAIGKARAVSELNGKLFVLDSDWKKILVYDSNGVRNGSLGEGYGVQPGQLALPVDMADRDGVLYVLDYELKRISMWDTAGEYRGDIELQGMQPRGIEVAASGIYVKFMFPQRGHWAARVDSSGGIVEYVFPVDSSDAPFSEAGYNGALATTVDGTTVLFIHGSGALLQSTAAATRTQIEPVARLTTQADGLTVAERATYGAVSLPQGQVALLRSRRDWSVPADSNWYELAVYDSTGRLVGEHRFPPGSVPLSVDRGSRPDIVNVTFLGQDQAVARFLMEVQNEG